MLKTLQISVLALALALCGLVAVACGGGSDEPVEPAREGVTATTPPTTMPVSDDPVRIGVIFDHTGDLSDFGPNMQNAADLSAALINDAGGILDRPLEAIHKDGATQPQVSTDAANALVKINGAEVIVGPVASSSTLAVAQAVTIPNGILHISPAATSPAMTVLDDNDFVFRVRVSDNVQGVVLARLARELGYDTAAAIYINNPYGEGLANVFRDSFDAMGGRTTALVPQESGQPTYQSEVDNATRDAPDVLVAVAYPQSTEIFVREALEGDYIDTFMFVSAVRSQEMFDAIASDKLEGSYGTAPGTPMSDATDAFLRLYEERYGETVDIPLVGEAFDAFTLAALAIEKAGEYDGAAARTALREISNPPGVKVGPGDIARALELIRSGEDIDYEGVTGSQNFDENGDVLNAIEIWQIVNGEITPTGRYEKP